MQVEEFKKKCGTLLDSYEKKQIYPSEMFAFCNYVELFKVDYIIESGTYHGHSVEILATMFPGIKIKSYELREPYYNVAKKILKKYKNIELIHGVINPKKLKCNKKTAMLIDGPKGKHAIALAENLVKKVAFIAIHDMGNYISELEEKFSNGVHTGTIDDEIKALDHAVPYKENHHLNGMYGTVLAMVWE